MVQEQCYPIGTTSLCNKLQASTSYDYIAKLNTDLPRHQ